MINALKIGIKLLPHVINIGQGIYNIVQGKKKEEERKQEINQAFKRKLDDLNEQENLLRERNHDYQRRISQLEQKLRDNMYQLEEANRMQIEREKRLLEKEEEEQKEKMRQLEEERKAVEKCKESLENEFSEGIVDIIENFSKEEEKWINSLQTDKIEDKIKQLKKELNILFDNLFDYENIMEKINNKFLNIIKTNFHEIELEKMNFMIIGTSGVGKSTLINEIFGEPLAKEGMGTRTTIDTKRYESKLVPFLSLFDTMGTELGSGHKLSDVLKETLNEIMNKLDSNNPNDHIHCILYCTTSNRFFKDELEVILKLREKYDGKKLPIVIVYTRAVKEEDAESIKNAINNFLKEHGETLSDDIFGITFIKVNAREDEIKSIGNVTIFPCFGLSHLMNICFKKGEKSYRFAIKNSLIQIGKKAIQEYLDTISNKILNNYVYFDYLCLKFEPNFINYIAFCFEKITDIYEQKGIKDEECNNLSDYMEHYQINRDQNLKNLNIIHCMVCNKIPKNPYKCKLCESEICENCYLEEEYFACKNCENEEFDRVDNKCDDEKKEDEETENKINLNINQENSSENYLNKNEIKEEKDLSKENCMICDKQIQTPLKCNNCEYKVCENCYLTKLQDDGYYSCDNCGKEEFELDENEGIKDEIKKNDENKIEDGEENENKLNLNPNYINDSADFNNYLRNLQETEGKKLSKELCMICNQPPSEPLKCMKCGYRICYMCYLKKLDSQGTYVCEKCDFGEFEEASNDKEEPIEKNNKITKRNYSEILNNNLKIESITEIKKFRDKFQKELIEEFNPKFDEFAKKSANDIYIKVAEKYFELNQNKNIKMKTRAEMNEEAIEEINKSLKPKAQENFLSKFASQLFKDIVTIFKKKCEEKLDKFIENLLNNKEANEFFKNCDDLNENKKLKFEKELKEYIEKLDKKEQDSYKKALSASGQSCGSNCMGESSSSVCSSSGPSKFQGDS